MNQKNLSAYAQGKQVIETVCREKTIDTFKIDLRKKKHVKQKLPTFIQWRIFYLTSYWMNTNSLSSESFKTVVKKPYPLRQWIQMAENKLRSATNLQMYIKLRNKKNEMIWDIRRLKDYLQCESNITLIYFRRHSS